MIAAVYWPDVVRFAAVVLGSMAMALLPGVLTHRVLGWRVWLIVAVVVLLFLGMIVATLAHLGEPLRWYHGPVLLVASILSLVYVISIRGTRFWYDP